MNTKWLLIALLGANAFGFSQGALEQCGNGYVSFEMYNSSVAGLYKGYLTVGHYRTVLNCSRSKAHHGSIIEEIACTEARNGDNLISVSIESGGFTNERTLSVKMPQMFPLPPVTTDFFRCPKLD